MKIGFVGNWGPLFSTENERKWSFEQLGHQVITFQENETSAKELLKAMPKLNLLIYSHTHGWEIEGLIDVFKAYRKKGVPTASVHLDLWVGLDREKDMGREATWFTEWIFMADGSPEAVKKYEEMNLNWYWLKPAVVARACYVGEFKQGYEYDVLFTGSRGYHPEYPFRKELVDGLREIYGSKFAHYGNDGIKVVRQGELNCLYRSAKVVVGDSCFAGREKYVSDRYYEVRGRFGFLLHPHVKGIDTHGVGAYIPQSLASLQSKIDYYLENEKEREAMRLEGHNWVKNNETYTARCASMLDTIFGKNR